jgi:hypothetical protein
MANLEPFSADFGSTTTADSGAFMAPEREETQTNKMVKLGDTK